MPIRIKKKRYKLTTAGKLVFSLIALILITSLLYNMFQIKTINDGLESTRKDVAILRDEISSTKSELEAIHDRIILTQPSYYQIMDGPFIDYEEFQACDPVSTFKSWMDYQMITDTTSRQWSLQQESKTNVDGHLLLHERMYIAIANFNIGDELNITLTSGTVVNAIVGDNKATDCAHPDGSVIEFIVDKDKMDPIIKMSGNYNDIYQGAITLIERVGNHYE